MTIDEAKDLLDNLIGFIEDSQGSDYDEALKMAIKALKQEPCEDAIIRQAVEDAIARTIVNGEELGYLVADDILSDLPSVTPWRWIPVSERLPEVNGKYLVTETTTVKGLMGEYITVEMYANDLYKIDEFDFSDKQGVASWYNFDGEYGYYEVDNVIAWMPLPEPYKAESEDKE